MTDAKADDKIHHDRSQVREHPQARNDISHPPVWLFSVRTTSPGVLEILTGTLFRRKEILGGIVIS